MYTCRFIYCIHVGLYISIIYILVYVYCIHVGLYMLLCGCRYKYVVYM